MKTFKDILAWFIIYAWGLFVAGVFIVCLVNVAKVIISGWPYSGYLIEASLSVTSLVWAWGYLDFSKLLKKKLTKN